MPPPPVARFRVVSAFVAFHPFIKTKPFVTVPLGSIFETRQEIQSPGLTEIRLNDQPLFAFMRDIEERAQRMDQPNS